MNFFTHKFITDNDDFYMSEEPTYQPSQSRDLRPEGFTFIILINLSKFIADIDEASPSEDEEAAQRALHGTEDRDLRPEGLVFILNKSLYSSSNSLQILMRPLLRKMRKLCNVLFMEQKMETYVQKVFLFSFLINRSTQLQIHCRY